jgi:hypothetical protein
MNEKSTKKVVARRAKQYFCCPAAGVTVTTLLLFSFSILTHLSLLHIIIIIIYNPSQKGGASFLSVLLPE